MAYDTTTPGPAAFLPAPALPVCAGSVICDWTIVVKAGGPAILDASGSPRNPEVDITDNSRIRFPRPPVGTYIALRLAFDKTLVVSASPQIMLFGRKIGSGAAGWQLLLNRANAAVATLDAGATCNNDGTLAYTAVHALNNVWDTLGCEEFINGIAVALAGTVGVTSTSTIQAKIL